MMHSKSRLLIIFTLIMLSAHAFASEGVGTRGGGCVVVCNKPNGSISSVKLLDLYQASLERGLEIPRSHAPVISQIDNALKSLNKYFAYDVKEAIGKIKSDYLPTNITLIQPYDFGNDPVQIEDGCHAEWVAYYSDNDDQLKIVTKYFNLLSPTDQAALFIHEGIYKLARKNLKEVDSQRTRQIVGMIFSSNPNRFDLARLSIRRSLCLTSDFYCI